MSLIKKYKFEFLICFGIIVIYFIFRLPNLTLQPIFADEAIYIRWAQIIKAEPTLRFISLQDGKTPLFMWAMVPFFKVFSDPLYAGRFLSAVSGFFTMGGLLFLGLKFFNPRVGIWAAFLYSIAPFSVLFDRMALVDSMLAAFSVWSLILALLLIKFPRFDLAMCLGYLLGGGLLTKPPAFLNVFALSATLFMFNWNKEGRQGRLIRLFGFWIITIIITLVIYNILRLGPGFSNLNARSADYVRDPMELLKRPTDPFIPHFNDLKDWSIRLLGLPFLIAFFSGIFVLVTKKNSENKKTLIAIILWGLIPLFIQMTFLRTFTARYVLFCIMPAFLLAAFGIDYFITRYSKKGFLKVIVLILLLSYPVYFNYFLITDSSLVPLPKNERIGYLEDWTAGYGLKEIANFLIEKSKDGIVIVGTEGGFGTLPDGLEIYLDKHSHSAPESQKIVVLGQKYATVSAQLKDSASEHPTYFVGNHLRILYLYPGLNLIKEYPKVIGSEKGQGAILLFEVKAEKNSVNDSTKNLKK